ncbi:hypothetical protein, partial [Staphylococcus aureus]
MKALLIASAGALTLMALAAGLILQVLDDPGSWDRRVVLALLGSIILLATGLGAVAWRIAGRWNTVQPV